MRTPTRTETSPRWMFAVAIAMAACAPNTDDATTPVATLSFSSGALAEVFLTRTAADGDTLVAVGRWPDRRGPDPDGVMSWSVHPIGDIERSVLGLDLRSGQNLPDRRRVGIGGPYREGDVYVPVRVRGRSGSIDYVWSGAALVPAGASGE